MFIVHHKSKRNTDKGVFMEQQTFGKFLRQKRLEKKITLRGFAALLPVAPVYICDIEKDRKAAPSAVRLQRIAEILLFSQQEIDEMHDLAAMSQSRPVVSNDLPEYIMENEIVRIALRTAKDANATDKEWEEFIKKLNKRIVPAERREKKDRQEDT
jgi:transcriptional regulator with XRE-family HTH domain